jgi:hypothetical protein
MGTRKTSTKPKACPPQTAREIELELAGFMEHMEKKTAAYPFRYTPERTHSELCGVLNDLSHAKNLLSIHVRQLPEGSPARDMLEYIQTHYLCAAEDNLAFLIKIEVGDE